MDKLCLNIFVFLLIWMGFLPNLLSLSNLIWPSPVSVINKEVLS